MLFIVPAMHSLGEFADIDAIYHLYTDDDWLTDGNTKLALSEAERLMNAGRKMILDRELAARICVMLCQYQLIVVTPLPSRQSSWSQKRN